jgi:hypothetical protein
LFPLDIPFFSFAPWNSFNISESFLKGLPKTSSWVFNSQIFMFFCKTLSTLIYKIYGRKTLWAVSKEPPGIWCDITICCSKSTQTNNIPLVI